MSASRPFHIAYLVQQFPPEVGAGPARVTEMSRRWLSLGARVTVITGMPIGRLPGQRHGNGDPAYDRKLFLEEEMEGVRVLRSWLYRSGGGALVPTLLNNASFMVTSTLHALARLGTVDVLIASEPPLFPHVGGAVVARLRNIPLVLEVRDLWPDYLVGMGVLKPHAHATRALFALERMLLRRARHVVVVTDSFRRRIVNKGVAADRCSVIANGVDPSYYYRESSEPPLRALARSSPDDFIIGYLGTIGTGQHVESIVDAAALLAVEDRSVRIVLAGDGPHRERAAARAAELRLPNLVLHLMLPKEQTRAFYNACDACLVPLAPVAVFQETIPSKIFEVMACERPVVGCLEGEGRRIIEESRGGVTARPGDPRAIADAILQLKQRSIEERETIGRAGRAYVVRHYNRQSLADRYLDILARAAERPAGLTRTAAADAYTGD